MSKVYFTSDWHLGHKNIHLFRTAFSSPEEHNEFIFSNYKKIITKRDTIWFLGDMVFSSEYLPILKELPGNKLLVAGNHDIGLDEIIASKVFNKVFAFTKYKDYWLSHPPIHESELRGKKNIHGHTHFKKVFSYNGYEDTRYVNVCLEQTNYFPISFEDIKKK